MKTTFLLGPRNKKPAVALHGADTVRVNGSRYPSQLLTVCQARHDAVAIVRQWDVGYLADRVELIISELVTNAVQATQKVARLLEVCSGHPPNLSIEVTLTLIRDSLITSVTDTSLDPPRIHYVDDEALHGRGLPLVAAMCSDWGYYRPPDGGKVVWCEVRTHTLQ